MNKDSWLRVEEPINILQASVRRLRIEEKCDRNKTGADDRPNDPEPPS